MKRSKTNRGFDLIEFKDLYQIECSIQKSSLADDQAIWIGVNDADPKIMASMASGYGVRTSQTTGWVNYPLPDAVTFNTRMHLNRKQVAKLLPILQHFAATGEISRRSIRSCAPAQNEGELNA